MFPAVHAKSWLLVLASLLCTASACSSAASEPRGPEPSVEVRGEVGLALQLSDGSDIAEVRYELTRGSATVRSGTLAVDAYNRASGTIAEVAAGDGYTINLAADRTRSGTPVPGCFGSSTNITVIARETTSVAIVLQCEDSANPGNIAINGTFNSCPRITSASASPTVQKVGASIVLASTVSDRDNDPVSVSWFVGATYSPSNTFAVTANATFTCSAPGTFSLGARIYDGDQRGCARFLSPPMVVVCTGAADAGAPRADSWPEASSACGVCLAEQCSAYTEDQLPVLQDCADSACRAIVSCELSTHCVTNDRDLLLCYCGGVGETAIDACFGLDFVPYGPCRTLIEAGQQTNDVRGVLERWLDPSFVAGRANRLSTCLSDLCREPCLADGPRVDGGRVDAGRVDGGPVVVGTDASLGGSDGAVSGHDAATDAAVPSASDAGPVVVSDPFPIFTDGGWPLGSAACATCQRTQCTSSPDDEPLLDRCSDSVCRAIVACEFENHCVGSQSEVLLCYCGGATTVEDVDACFGALFVPYGPCRELIAAGVQATSHVNVLERFLDPSYAGGRANQLTSCIGELCSTQCDGPPGP